MDQHLLVVVVEAFLAFPEEEQEEQGPGDSEDHRAFREEVDPPVEARRLGLEDHLGLGEGRRRDFNRHQGFSHRLVEGVFHLQGFLGGST